MTKPELIQLIEEAGFEAVERDTVYNRIERVAVA
jgi:2-iminoacetate synthase ThiH